MLAYYQMDNWISFNHFDLTIFEEVITVLDLDYFIKS